MNTKSAPLLASVLAFVFGSVAIHAQSDSTCRIDGGDAECRNGIGTPWWWWWPGPYTDPVHSDPYCVSNSPPYQESQHCTEEDQTWQAVTENVLSGAPYACAPPDRIFLNEGITKKLGIDANVGRSYDVTIWWDPYGGQAGSHCDPIVFPNRISIGRRDVFCPAGYHEDSRGQYCYGTKKEVCPVGNPIQCADGQKIQAELDRTNVGSGIEFIRYYSSSGFYNSPGTSPEDVLGPHWRHSWQRSVAVESPVTQGQTTFAYVVRPDGDYRHFRWNGQTWDGRKDKSETLQELTSQGQRTGWRYTDATDGVENYDAAGTLLSIVSVSGKIITLSYSDTSTPPEIAPNRVLKNPLTSVG